MEKLIAGSSDKPAVSANYICKTKGTGRVIGIFNILDFLKLANDLRMCGSVLKTI
jgi:hypothetical protein